MVEGDIHVLLAIQIRRVRTNAPFKPVICRIVARQVGVTVVILRHARGNTAGDHRLFIILLGQHRLLLITFEPCRVAVNQRLRLAGWR
ncbi:hypothetical protein D3C72_1187800 [compost metagenome]